MKQITLAFITLIFSVSSFAACPDHNTSLRLFLNEVTTKYNYIGDRVEVATTTGSRPTVRSRPGRITFSKLGRIITVSNMGCSTDGQCEQENDKRWVFSPLNRCLYVDGVSVRITKATPSILKFVYTRKGVEYRENYQLLDKSLLVNTTSEDSTRFEYIWFNGR
jgi:hypothetical protein